MQTDVVISGASVAGCTLATLLGRQGVRVVLLEKSSRPDHHKVTCSHFLQSTVGPVFERLGIIDELRAAGAVDAGAQLWTEGTGWFAPEADGRHGLSLRRAKLDPLLRRLAERSPNVDVRAGTTVQAVLRDADGRPRGLHARTASGETVSVEASLVVGADGRGSTTARLARVPGRVLPNNRFAYMAYFDGVDVGAGGLSKVWFVDRDVYYAFPTDGGQTIAACFLHKDRLPEFKGASNKAAVLERLFARLPDAPDLAAGRRTSPVIGKLDVPNVRRPAARPGLAFVGDAAQASDPVWGVGVGFALQSAGWLADEVAGPLRLGGDVDAALERYRRRHRTQLAGHHLLMSDFASGRPMNLIEKTLYRAATVDPQSSRLIHELGSRSRPLQQTLTIRRVARAARYALAA